MISRYLTQVIPDLPERVACDPQRTRLYRLEREFVGGVVNHVVSRKKLQELSNHACRYYRIKPIKVVVFDDPRQRFFSEVLCYTNNDGTPDFGHLIRLNKGFHGANVCSMLHELAHYIADDTYHGSQGHGKQFVGIYMHLLAKYRVLPRDCFRLLAKRYRIKIGGKFKPDAIRG